MSLKSGNISLRAIEPSDINILFSWENDTQYWVLSNTMAPYSKHVLNKYLDNAHLDIYEAKQLRMVIEVDGIKPIGLAASDTLRLEMGYCLYGNDIDDTTSPIEAGLGWITKFTKDFTNSEAIKAEKERGIENKLIAFELDERGIPRQGYDIVDHNGNKIGRVTSGTMSPSLGKGIGLGYVPKVFADFHSKINIQIRKKAIPATVIKLPFYKG